MIHRILLSENNDYISDKTLLGTKIWFTFSMAAKTSFPTFYLLLIIVIFCSNFSNGKPFWEKVKKVVSKVKCIHLKIILFILHWLTFLMFQNLDISTVDGRVSINVDFSSLGRKIWWDFSHLCNIRGIYNLEKFIANALTTRFLLTIFAIHHWHANRAKLLRVYCELITSKV